MSRYNNTLNMRCFLVYTANKSFYQIHRVCALTEERAIQLAEKDANQDWIIQEEEYNADCIGLDSPGEYKMYKVNEVDCDVTDKESCEFKDSGPNG